MKAREEFPHGAAQVAAVAWIGSWSGNFYVHVQQEGEREKKKKKSKPGINVHQNLLRKTKYQDALMGEFHKNEASCYTLTILKMTIIAVVF